MSKPFDATTKRIIDTYSPDWVGWLLDSMGVPRMPVAGALDGDLSTFSMQADKLFRLGQADGPILHVEVQAGRDESLPGRTLRYNILCGERYHGPVYSVVVLLRPEADFPALNGVIEHRLPDQRVYHRFEYFVVRLWEQPAARLLAGGEGLWPLALLTDEARARPQELLEQVLVQVSGQHWPDTKEGDFWTSVQILLGLRFGRTFVNNLLAQVQHMKESTTYQAILEEGERKGLDQGRREALRANLLHLGELRFGKWTAGPFPLDTCEDADRLQRMMDRILTATDWNDLLSTP